MKTTEGAFRGNKTMMNPAKRFVISAASGTGKTSLTRALMQKLPDVALSISHTTRAPRPGEQHGVHYYFVTPPEFERMATAGAFLEHAEVFGNRYGTSRDAVEGPFEGSRDPVAVASIGSAGGVAGGSSAENAR